MNKYLIGTDYNRVSEIDNIQKENATFVDINIMAFVEGTFYFENAYEGKVYSINDKFWQLLKDTLEISEDVYIREGFYDRSLNTTIYAALNKFEINIEGFVIKVDKIEEFLNWKNNYGLESNCQKS